tara:strand:+ start:103 stop:471 length:369 start_codon:yes stop_codon:yes gene_type:complete
MTSKQDNDKGFFDFMTGTDDDEPKITDNKSKVENKVKGFINPKISLNTDKYPTLQFVSGLLKFFSIAVVIIPLIIFSTREEADFLLFLPSFIYSIITAICMYAYGELITLFIDVEKNTRKSK